MTAGDLARRAGSIERTGSRAVAECLSAVHAWGSGHDENFDHMASVMFKFSTTKGITLDELLVEDCGAVESGVRV
jgi:hypothetical protein